MADVEIKTAAERLQVIDQAIEEIMIAGQSYKLGSRQLTRADIKQLRAMRTDIQNEMAAANSAGVFAKTFVAEFDGR